MAAYGRLSRKRTPVRGRSFPCGGKTSLKAQDPGEAAPGVRAGDALWSAAQQTAPRSVAPTAVPRRGSIVTMAVSPAPPAPPPAELTEDREQRVTNLELFFDLVFVFAITQVTALMADDPTWRGLAAGMLVFAALWQAWVAYAWLTNAIDPDEDVTRLTVFAAMAAMVVAALAAPGALGDHAVAFAVAYLVVRALHVFLYMQRTDDPGVHRAVRRMAGPLLTTPVLLLAAALLLDGAPLRWAWLGILAFDVAGVFLAGSEGWVGSASHFVERHGLVVIIALGESIVAVGAGAEGLDAGVVAGAVLGVVGAAGLWWAYSEDVAVVAARRLAAPHAAARARMARTS